MSIVTDKSNFGNFYRPILAWLVALLFFFPIFWMIFTSFKTDADAVKPEFLLFFKPTFDNYLNMTDNYDYWRFAIFASDGIDDSVNDQGIGVRSKVILMS